MQIRAAVQRHHQLGEGHGRFLEGGKSDVSTLKHQAWFSGSRSATVACSFESCSFAVRE